EALPPARDCVVRARLRHVAEAVRAPVAHRAEAEERPVGQPELDAVQLARAERRQAAPDHLAAVDGPGAAERRLADARAEAVGADDQGVLAGGAIAEPDRDAALVMAERRHPGPEAAGHGGGGGPEGLVQPGALDADHRADVAPQRLQVGIAEHVAGARG